MTTNEPVDEAQVAEHDSTSLCQSAMLDRVFNDAVNSITFDHKEQYLHSISLLFVEQLSPAAREAAIDALYTWTYAAHRLHDFGTNVKHEVGGHILHLHPPMPLDIHPFVAHLLDTDEDARRYFAWLQRNQNTEFRLYACDGAQRALDAMQKLRSECMAMQSDRHRPMLMFEVGVCVFRYAGLVHLWLKEPLSIKKSSWRMDSQVYVYVGLTNDESLMME